MPRQTIYVAKRIARLAGEKKAENIRLLDVRKLTDLADFFVICSSESPVHVKAIADYIDDTMRTAGYKVHHSEGLETRRWVVLDFIDVVVHIFEQNTRTHYGLEEYWGDAIERSF